jgi:hypothetical protein
MLSRVNIAAEAVPYGKHRTRNIEFQNEIRQDQVSRIQDLTTMNEQRGARDQCRVTSAQRQVQSISDF